MDWSYAGYMAGEAPIPKLPLVGTVKDFGAVGDGVADDTQVCSPTRHTDCTIGWSFRGCATNMPVLGRTFMR